VTGVPVYYESVKGSWRNLRVSGDCATCSKNGRHKWHAVGTSFPMWQTSLYWFAFGFTTVI